MSFRFDTITRENFNSFNWIILKDIYNIIFILIQLGLTIVQVRDFLVVTMVTIISSLIIFTYLLAKFDLIDIRVFKMGCDLLLLVYKISINLLFIVFNMTIFEEMNSILVSSIPQLTMLFLFLPQYRVSSLLHMTTLLIQAYQEYKANINVVPILFGISNSFISLLIQMWVDQSAETLNFQSNDKDLKVMRIIHDLKNPVLSILESIKPLKDISEEHGKDPQDPNNKDKTKPTNKTTQANPQVLLEVCKVLLEVFNNVSFELEDIQEMMENLRMEFKAKNNMQFLEEKQNTSSIMFIGAYKNTHSKLAESCNNQMVLTIKAGFPTYIQMQKSLLKRVINNFITNSLKHTQNGRVEINFSVLSNQAVENLVGQISVGAELEFANQYLCFEVTDSGKGIPKDKLAKIFDEKESDQSANNWDGTGLGLPICRSIVEALGCRIFQNSIQGKWTSFKLLMPANFVMRELGRSSKVSNLSNEEMNDKGNKQSENKQSNHGHTSSSSPEESALTADRLAELNEQTEKQENDLLSKDQVIDLNFSLTNKKNFDHKCSALFIAEDNKTICNRQEAYMKKQGLHYETFLNGLDCLEQVKKDLNFNCDKCSLRMVITDMQMPQMDGLQLAAKLRSLKPTKTVRIVLLSADELGDDDQEKTKQFDEVLTKPLKMAKLKEWTKQVENHCVSNEAHLPEDNEDLVYNSKQISKNNKNFSVEDNIMQMSINNDHDFLVDKLNKLDERTTSVKNNKNNGNVQVIDMDEVQVKDIQ